jgi:hypothetical protein
VRDGVDGGGDGAFAESLDLVHAEGFGGHMVGLVNGVTLGCFDLWR